ncbi:hypothetical protein C353_03657 [Cryptococcus neoformans AD1-83a]|nr:hypothetical protein C353_03657 [Cryptococcus neoformans var. grubii AD1-83a]
MSLATPPVVAPSSVPMDDAEPSFSPFHSAQSPSDGQGVDSDHSPDALEEMTDSGNGMNDDGFSYVGETFLDCDLDSASAFDRESRNLDSILAKWTTKVANCLIPSGNPYTDCSAFYPPQTKGPLLASLIAIFAVLLTTFVGLPQRFGDMIKAIIHVLIKVAVSEDRESLRLRVQENEDLTDSSREEMLRILNAPINTSSSNILKNVKSLYRRLDIDPVLIIHPKCPTKDCQNVLYDVISRDGWGRIPDKCPECASPLKENGKLTTEFFGRRALQDELEYFFSIDGIERLVEQQEIIRARQRERDNSMDRPRYLQNAKTGKILRHQLDGSCYVNFGNEREKGALLLTINISVDWADPSKSRNRSPRSMGPILCQLADLPNQYRSQFGFMMLMGITPAPHEPPGVLLHRLLLPLAVELLSAGADGLWIKTPNYKQGQKVFVRIGTICCDRLAAVAITGSPHFAKKDSPCMKCTQCSHSSASFSGSLSKPHKLHGNPMWLAVQAAKPKRLGQQLIPWSSLSSRCPVISQFSTSSQTSTKSYTQSSTQCMRYLKEFFPSIFDGSVFWGDTVLYLQPDGRQRTTKAVLPR